MLKIQHNYDNYRGIKAGVSQLPHLGTPGTWNIGGFNLPDFGLTEAFGSSQSGSGGGNTFQNQAIPYASPPAVLGTSTQSTGGGGSWGGASTPTTTTPTTTTTGGGGGGNTGTLRQQMESGQIPWDDNLLAQAEASNRDINAEIENAFNAKLGYLNQAEGVVRNDFPTIQNEINQNYEGSANTLRTEQAAGERQIGMQEEGGVQRKEDALTAARRLYNELITGGQQRFGGASTAGEAYQSLAGREMQRNQRSIQQNFSQFMGQVTEAKRSLQEKVVSALQTLETQKNTALQNARREFDSKLLEISRLKSEAASDKASARLSALQDLRNQIFQINLVSAQMKQQAEQQAQQGLSVLDNAVNQFGQSVQGAQTAGGQLNDNVALDYRTGLGISAGRGPSGFDTQTGMINFRTNPDEEQMLVQQGQIAPSQDDFMRNMGLFAGR